MTRSELYSRHLNSYQVFGSYISTLSEEDFNYAHAGEKWDAGEQLDHNNMVVALLAKIFSLPKFAIKLKFGKSNRPSKTFEELVAKYTKGIEMGYKAPSDFEPKKIEYALREKQVNKLLKNIEKINRKLEKYSDHDLDIMILPHPALGKLTVREMIYFSTHHVEDHMNQTKRNLSYRD